MPRSGRVPPSCMTKAQRVVRRYVFEDGISEPGIAGEQQVSLRLDKRPFAVDRSCSLASGNSLARSSVASQRSIDRPPIGFQQWARRRLRRG